MKPQGSVRPRKRGGTGRLASALALAVATVLVAAACSAGGGSTQSDKTTLTLWENFGGAYNGTATRQLATAFEKTHPNIKIEVVSQPADNYFSLLQAAALSRSGPDLLVMWGGLYAIQHKSYLQNLKDLVPAKDTSKLAGMRWVSEGFDVSKGAYMVPLEDQFYAGFYNKALFKKADITAPPQTWTELYQDCQKLKDAGVPNCIYYASGSTNQAATGAFYPWYEMSYLMIGAIPLDKLQGLYNGDIPWTSSVVTSQLQKWQDLYSKGYTNKDVLTAHQVMTAFEKGESAMIMKGNWVVPDLTKSLGDDLGVMVPPYSDTPIKGVAEFPGDGYSMTNYSSHKKEAAEFLKFMATPAAAKIVDANNLIPAVEGAVPSKPINQQLLAFREKDGMTQYPLVDNVLQADIVDAATRLLPQLLAGQITVTKVAQELEKTWKALPKEQRGSSWASYTVK